MKMLHTIKDVRQMVEQWKQEGHKSLIERCRAENDRVVVSIFVNPIQFGPTEDLETYPRDIKSDSSLCESLGVDVIFLPTPDIMYKNCKTAVVVDDLSVYLCGASRPVHFSGVCTVVSKLFNIIQPSRAYFGEKNRQQLRIVEKMVEDLNIPVQIIGVPIVREADGLAKSSRNSYLTPVEREAATVLYKSLLAGQDYINGRIKSRESSVISLENSVITTENSVITTKDVIEIIIHTIHKEPLTPIDYVSIVDYETMAPVVHIDYSMGTNSAETKTYILALAVYIGHTRLIDNIAFTLSSKGGR